MWQRGRPIDPVFDLAEVLYCRLRVRDASANARLTALLGQLASDEASDPSLRDAVAKELMPQLKFPRFPTQSMNRGKYGLATDVLYPDFFDEIVLASTVGDATVARHEIPGQRNAPSPGWLCIDVAHRPLEDNYGHCEMKVERYDFGALPRVLGPDDGGDVPPALKTTWRRQVSRRCQVVYVPPTDRV